MRAARRNADAELARSRDRSTTPRLAGRGARHDQEPPRSRAFAALARTRRERAVPARGLPVNRNAVRADSATFAALADRLADLDRPVAARGVVLLRRLLVDPSGPLYDRERAEELPAFLDALLEALEPR